MSRIDEATEKANHCEGASTLEPGAIWAMSPAAVRRPTQGLVTKWSSRSRAAVVVGVADQGR